MNIPTPIPFEELLALACKGSEEAARKLYNRCRGDLLTAIRDQLGKARRVRHTHDSDDFLQSVWGSFLREPEHQVFKTPEDLLKFLQRVARNKVKDATRREHGPEENPRHRNPMLDNSEPNLSTSDPTPSQELIAEEIFDQILAGESETIQRILTLLRKGFRQKEIARFIGVSEARVTELLKRFKARRERHDPEQGDSDGA